jgi:hypothetical protein
MTPIRDTVEDLRDRLAGRQGLVLAVIDAVDDVPREGSAKLLQRYQELTERLRATLREMHGDWLPPGPASSCGVHQHDVIPPCRIGRDHSPDGSRFISSFHVWREDDVWIIATSCFAEHPEFSHYVIVLGLARDGFEGMGAMSA